MQSQYGLPEIQQFMADGGCSPLFSISTADVHPSSQPQKPQHHHHSHSLHHQQQQLHHHQHLHLHHHHHPQMQLRQPPPLPPPPSLHHFHTVPMTQQLFHHGHQFHLFQQEQQRRIHQQLVQLGLDHDSGPENSTSPTRIIAAASGGGGAGISPFLSGVDFKLGVNDSIGGGDSRERLNDEEGILQVDDGEEIHHIHPWTTREDSNIKEPFWRPLDIDYSNRNSKRCKEKQPDASNSASNFKLFSELEAICKPINSSGDCGGGGNRPSVNNNQQTGSGSVLTGENPPAISTTPRADYGHNTETADQGSDSSTGEEAAQIQKPTKSDGGKKRKRRQHQLSSIAAFMEGLVKKLMEHQEGLHRKFLEILDRRDRERMDREETWRQQEAAKATSEAMAKAQDQALATSREAAIVFFLEKITGESLNLPTREQFHSPPQEETSHKEEPKHVDGTNPAIVINPSRWPKAEVQALIQVRSNLESRFQEPGLKGPLWEEVSSAMAAMGYQRSAKRCKEKWENINKYFRKTKDSIKKRSHHSKTCPYFHQLDQLYSKSPAKPPPPVAAAADRGDMSELLHTVMAANDEAHEADRSAITGKGALKLPWRKPNNSEDNDDDDDDEDDDDDDDDDEGEDEGEEADRESQGEGSGDPRS